MPYPMTPRARILPVLLAALFYASAAAGQSACDRACLDAHAQDYLNSLGSGFAHSLDFAETVRITEDGAEIAPGEGFWRRAVEMRQHRLNVLDPRLGVAAGLAVMDVSGGGIALLAYRLKLADGAFQEIETMVVAPDDIFLFEEENLIVPREDFLIPVPAAGRESRAELRRIAQYYPDGLKAGSFEEVDAPMPDHAERMENGVILAGPRCTLNENCLVMKTQPSPTRPTLRQRLLAIDEEQGIVFMWLDWMQQSGQTLQVYEAFKIYDGQIQSVDAFIKHGDPDAWPGWPLD